MEFLMMDWLGTPVWFWMAFLGLVVALTAFDLGILHKEDKEMGIGESLKLSAFYISIALAFGVWVYFQKTAAFGPEIGAGGAGGPVARRPRHRRRVLRRERRAPHT